MPEITHPKMLEQIGTGRPKGSKNKKITAAKISQRYRELAASENAEQALYEFWKQMMNDPNVRWSERLKASEALAKRIIVSADVETLTENKATVETAEEALAILQGLDGETS